MSAGGAGGTPRLVVTGFMGAGKTTVAAALARLVGGARLDLDDLITAREGRTPRQLIDEEGEQFFRDAETRALRAVLADEAARVGALGGGAWALERNRRLVAESGCLAVWLDAPFDLCWRRIAEDRGEDRPNARDPRAAGALYDARRESYALAPVRVGVTPERSPEDLAAEILRAARSAGAAA
jgi:shikimate kinase